MARLYLMRHGQTQFNLEGRVQGRCDSPLTPLGVEQAHVAGRWLAAHGCGFGRILASPLGRAMATAEIVRDELAAAIPVGAVDRAASRPVAPGAVDAAAERASRMDADPGAAAGRVPAVPPIEPVGGIIERSYGSFEGGPRDAVPADLWDPGDALEPYGGEGDAAVRARMVAALTGAMCVAAGADVLAVSHGSATRQFRCVWEDRARCDQNAVIGNCCIMVYEFDPADDSFTNVAIVNQEA